jgi:hypothetical protein
MRVVVIGLVATLAGCSACKQDAPPASVSVRDTPERIAVADPGRPKPPPPKGGPIVLTADEGTLTIDKAHGAPGQLTGHVRVAPARGFHVNVGYPMSLALEPTAGVTLTKTRLVKADAETFDEHGLALAVTATVDRPGTYAVAGTFDFAVCDEGSCRAKHQPVQIDFIAH